MPSPVITVDESVQVYYSSIFGGSAGSSGVISRGTTTSALTIPDSLSVSFPLLFSVSAFVLCKLASLASDVNFRVLQNPPLEL